MADGDSLAAWLRLAYTRGVRRDDAHALLAAFGLPGNIFSAPLCALRDAVPDRVARLVAAPPPDELRALIDRANDWLSQPGNHLVTLADNAYPRALLEVADPPLLLFARGRIALLNNMALAIVGSRHATVQGSATASAFAEAVSQAGLTVVSGLAAGIDAAAHQGGLRGHASTVAVIGTGADIVYPARHRALADAIAADGCIVSEYPLGTPPIAANFPRRNRIISGLSQGVLVIEAALASGSLITARMAAEQGRDVFAIPGSIHAPLAKGCHFLIKQGAKLVDSVDDILEELPASRQVRDRCPAPAAAGAGAESAQADSCHPLLAAMGHDPVAPDDLARRMDLAIGELAGQLLALELDGRIETLPGGLVRRLA